MIGRLWKSQTEVMSGGLKVSLYRSTRSRLIVAIGDVKGPMVKGFISFGKSGFVPYSSYGDEHSRGLATHPGASGVHGMSKVSIQRTS